MIYNALFKSNLEYGAISYFDKLNKTQLESLTTLQKQSLRLVFDAKPNLASTPRFTTALILFIITSPNRHITSLNRHVLFIDLPNLGVCWANTFLTQSLGKSSKKKRIFYGQADRKG